MCVCVFVGVFRWLPFAAEAAWSHWKRVKTPSVFTKSSALFLMRRPPKLQIRGS